MNRWKRMQPVRVTADVQSLARASGGRIDEIWTNDEYEAMVFYLGSEGRRGRVHLSIKRMDRGHVHDWRHLQSIKMRFSGPSAKPSSSTRLRVA